VPRPRLVARPEEGLAREPVLVYPQPDPARLPLTDRELQVLAMLAAGTPNQALAGELFISLDTVKSRQPRLGQACAANRTQAVARARDLGLLP
jgi:ATP/maltotriose-dependent transcriptional regulator MalT